MTEIQKIVEDEKLIENTKKAIEQAKHDRYMLEMSDDFCFSNGRYDEKTVYIRWLEDLLKKLEQE